MSTDSTEIQRSHPLRGLLVAQFFGAFNDNAWKQIVILLAIAAATAGLDPGTADFETASQKQTALASMVLILPLMLFSLPAGVVADRVSKRSVIIGMKWTELALMTAGTIALFVNPVGGWGALLVLGLMGAQSALFSPAKYGILPEILAHDKLARGNGVLEMWSNLAIIGGIALGPVLIAMTSGRFDLSAVQWVSDSFGVTAHLEMTLAVLQERTWLCGIVLIVLSAAGVVAAYDVPETQAAKSSEDSEDVKKSPAAALGDTLTSAWQAIRGNRILWLAFIGQILFWSVAALFPVAVFAYVKGSLGMRDSLTGVPMAVLGLGVGMGSLFAGRMSASKVEYGLLPMGSLGLTLWTALFALAAPNALWTNVLMALIGISSGLIVVPLNALLQWQAPADRRGAVIAVTNVFVFGGMLFGSGVGFVLSELDVTPLGTFGFSSVVLLGATVWVLRLLPDAFLRFVIILLANTFYKVTTYGRNKVPEEGGALLVPNHASFVDGLFLMASTDRPIRFIVYAKFFENPILGPFLRALRAIPISASGGPRMILRAFKDAGKYLDEGYLVCIFAEGQITRTGTLLPFQRGLQRIVKGRTAPIIPVYLDRALGSIFAPIHRKIIPDRIPYPVSVSFGDHLPSETPIHEVRRAVQSLGRQAWQQRKKDAWPLHQTFVHHVRRRPWRFAFGDLRKPRLSALGSIAGAVSLARALKKRWKGSEHVGIMLPPSVSSALLNIAASIAGKTSVNLNFTVGQSSLESACGQTGLTSVVTSREFIEKAKITLPTNVECVFAEDVAAGITTGEKMLALLASLLLPVRWLERFAGAEQSVRVDDVATVIFSSGSTGEPKGVMLTHFNIDSNVKGVRQVFRTNPDDCMMGILPHFHSFGYMTMWLAANERVGCVFHPNPLDAGNVGDLIERYQATILLATPTFLQVYMRRCTPAQFGSLRIVMAGAERLPERLRQAFEDNFGIRPLEGYGVTECSPVIAVSTTDDRGPGRFQPGSRRGYTGQALPGVDVKVVDPDSGEELPLDEPGMLLVKGPNVMKGYIGRDDLTEKVLRDGWYETGDVAQIDQDGFIMITGRLSRFSKIGGEMVPHGRVEEALQQAAGAPQQVFAVTSVSDEKKGEKLAVLHTLDEDEIPDVLEAVSSTGLPNLFIPRPDQFIKVDELPMLGTGKLDLRALKRIADERLSAKV